MKVMISIRRCTLNDDAKKLLIELQNCSFGHAYKNGKLLNDSMWWIAWDGNVPVGFCGLHVYDDVKTAFLCLAGVIDSHRGNGLQKRFIRVRERAAREAGCTRVISYTTPDNVWSANNLIACGYRLYIPTFQWGLSGACYFRKFI